MEQHYAFDAKICLYEGETNWQYVVIPADMAEKIRRHQTEKHRRTDQARVEVTIEKVTWRTTLFDQKSAKSYILPLKTNEKGKGKILVGDTIHVEMDVL